MKGKNEARSERRITIAFALSAIAGLALAAQYVTGPQVQVEGVLLAISFGGLGYGLVEWAKGLLHEGPEVGDYPDPPDYEEDEKAVEIPGKGWEESFGRRKLLTRMLGAAAGALGLALVFPIRSLGPSPGKSLLRTSWKKGKRLVKADGTPVRVGDLALEGIITVFPEHHTDKADSQTVLIRVDPSAIKAVRGREGWAPEGHVAYSKICTHAGCPVGLYRAATHDLFCPCHQSTFDVLDAARPVAGPATRPLPQLPLKVDDEGYLIAQDDFSAPVGPGFWNLP